MTKIRVYELAQKMGIDNKELIARLQGVGMDVKSHTASIKSRKSRTCWLPCHLRLLTIPHLSGKSPRKKSGLPRPLSGDVPR